MNQSKANSSIQQQSKVQTSTSGVVFPPERSHRHTHTGGATAPQRVCVSVRSEDRSTSDPLPPSNTGVEITCHWFRGSFDEPHDEVQGRIELLQPGSYIESLPYGGFGYRRQHVFVNGLRVYFEPSTDTMFPCMVECPGSACEMLGFSNLQILACNSKPSRFDVAFDHAPFTPRELATHACEGNIRTRAKDRHFYMDVGVNPDGETFEVGSRSSQQFLRVYDGRGFTRVELELKGKMAQSFLEVFLLPPEEFAVKAVGVLREFVDFVDTSSDSNVTRAPLLAFWEEFTNNLERCNIRVAGVVVNTLEKVQNYLEHQVAAMLYTFAKCGGSVGKLLQIGKTRVKRRHRHVMASVGAL